MTQYCTVGEKAKISFKLPDQQQENVISKNCPIEITSNQFSESNLIAHSGQVGTPCYRDPAWLNPESPARWVWSSFYANPNANADESASFSTSFEAVAGELLSLNVAVDNTANIIFNGNSIGQATSYSGTSHFQLTARQGANALIFNCINFPVGTTSPTANPAGLYFTLTSLSENCQFSISDSTGQIYNKRFRTCPNYEVSCGDECPPNHIRCKTTSYPGYCCLPCQPIARQINNLAARI